MLKLFNKIQSFHDSVYDLLQQIQKIYRPMNVFAEVIGDSKEPFRDNCYGFAQHLLLICCRSVVADGLEIYLQTINEVVLSLAQYKHQIGEKSSLHIPEEIYQARRKLVLSWSEIMTDCQQLKKNPEVFASEKMIQELLMHFAMRLSSDEFDCTPEIFNMAEKELEKNKKIKIVLGVTPAFYWLSLREYFNDTLYLAKMFSPAKRAIRLAVFLLSELRSNQIAELKKYILCLCKGSTNDIALVAQSQHLLPQFTASSNSSALNLNVTAFHPFVRDKKSEQDTLKPL